MSLAGGGPPGDPAGGSALFSGFRALGLYSNHLAHVLRYHRRHREFYLVTAVGRSFHTYNVKKLGIVAVSNALPQDITCLAADRMLVFASCGSVLYAFARNKEVVHIYKGHNADIHLVLPFGDHVISVDGDNVLIIWDVQSEEEYLQLNFDKAVFTVSAIMHPSTYLNKILLGSEQGNLQLWNVKTNKLLYTFPGWGTGVTVLEQAPALDVVAVGLVSGHIIVHNIKFDEMLMKFQQDWGPITAISFRTDGHAVMAAGSPIGHIGLWDLEDKKFLGQMRDAHSTAVSGISFVQGEPLLITNGSDNAIRVKIAPYSHFPQCMKDLIKVWDVAVDITSCGNFAVIGLTTGHVDIYNMQSGIHRGRYGKEKAHGGSIRGVAVDGLNQFTITAGSEGSIKFWKFKTRELVHSSILSISPSKMLLHRDSGILGIATDDFDINVLDIETRRTVRKFSGHRGQINDMAFSPDGRWLITASMDSTIRTWDLPSGCLVDCFLLDSAAVSITMSPTGDFLASSHVDDLGIYLWSNRSLYSLVSLRPLPADYEPSIVMLPGTCIAQDDDVLEEEEASDDIIEYDSPEQLGDALVTLSELPESRWKNLLNLDIIKSKLVNIGVLAQKSEFYMQLEEGLSSSNYTAPFNILKQMGPSTVDTELRSLSPDDGGSIKVMLSFLKMVQAILNTRRDFELAQAYLALFLKLHLKILSSEPTLLVEVSRLSPQLEEIWIHLQGLFNESLCILNYMKTALL
ncbi:hypothetical protein lerEdw1_000282 [Lerista edwardsae]|nr:hypothetical protein lerEdw1_000282 [Lerista edwardsae]